MTDAERYLALARAAALSWIAAERCLRLMRENSATAHRAPHVVAPCFTKAPPKVRLVPDRVAGADVPDLKRRLSVGRRPPPGIP
jgi:hypothetical protein